MIMMGERLENKLFAPALYISVIDGHVKKDWLRPAGRDRFKFCVNSKTDIRFMNSCKRAEPVFWFCPCLYYTGNFIPVNPAP